MRLNPPNLLVFSLALLLGGAGVAAELGFLGVLEHIAFWLLALGFVLLVFGSLFRRV